MEEFQKRMMYSSKFYPPMLPFMPAYGDFGFGEGPNFMPGVQGMQNSNGIQGSAMDMMKPGANSQSQQPKLMMAPFGDFNKFKSKGLAGIS